MNSVRLNIILFFALEIEKDPGMLADSVFAVPFFGAELFDFWDDVFGLLERILSGSALSPDVLSAKRTRDKGQEWSCNETYDCLQIIRIHFADDDFLNIYSH